MVEVKVSDFRSIWKEHLKCVLYCIFTMLFLLLVTYGREAFALNGFTLPVDFYTNADKRIGVVGVMFVDLLLLRWIYKQIGLGVWLLSLVIMMLGMFAPIFVTPVATAESSMFFNLYNVVTITTLSACLTAKFIGTSSIYSSNKYDTSNNTPRT